MSSTDCASLTWPEAELGDPATSMAKIATVNASSPLCTVFILATIGTGFSRVYVDYMLFKSKDIEASSFNGGMLGRRVWPG